MKYLLILEEDVITNRQASNQTKHLCILVPSPYLYQSSAVVQIMHIFLLFGTYLLKFGANLA